MNKTKYRDYIATTASLRIGENNNNSHIHTQTEYGLV